MQTLTRLEGVVRPLALDHDGKLVKQIGDAFMLVFDEAERAVVCGLELQGAATAQRDFPAVRIGAHTGEVLYREGDYVGTNVNIAARVAAMAQRDQFTISASTRAAAGAMPDVRYVELGPQHLKGIPEEVELFDAQHS